MSCRVVETEKRSWILLLLIVCPTWCWNYRSRQFRGAKVHKLLESTLRDTRRAKWDVGECLRTKNVDVGESACPCLSLQSAGKWLGRRIDGDLVVHHLDTGQMRLINAGVKPKLLIVFLSCFLYAPKWIYSTQTSKVDVQRPPSITLECGKLVANNVVHENIFLLVGFVRLLKSILLCLEK